MTIDHINEFNNEVLVNDIAKICGELTVECTDIAGVVSNQLSSAETIKTKQDLLVEQSEKLFHELTAVVHSTDDASELSKNAKTKLVDGNETIENALNSFHTTIELIDSQSKRIASLAGALEQVMSVTSSIDQIAKTTNMLALNATIEAEKAGESGATFAVVANEVKKLSNDTRVAADEISQTVNSLSNEARIFMDELNNGVNENKIAQGQLSDLKSLVTDVSKIINDVEIKNISIAQTTGAIYEAENANAIIRKEVSVGNKEMHNNLIKVHGKIHNLEEKSNEMFDTFVKSGLSPIDTKYVEKSIERCEHIRKITEDAIDSGQILLDDIFDKNLIKIEGSNPERFTNRLTHWADMNWRPIFDKFVESNDKVEMLICNSQDGFVPTHLSSRSNKPTGDLTHDTAYCRNGRVLLLPTEYHIKHSNAPYTMAVYRHDGDGINYCLMRNVYVPLFIKGKRWGDVELAYVL